MNIASEQEMLALGDEFANYLIGRATDLEEIPQSTRRAKLWEGKAQQDPSNSIVIELIGDVGAGKTTFVRGLAEGLGVKEPVTSPSFTISKSYALPTGGNLIHYDFYRLSDPGLMSEDLSENLANPNDIVVVEWADTISDILPQNRTKITISYNNDDTRKVTIS